MDNSLAKLIIDGDLEALKKIDNTELKDDDELLKTAIYNGNLEIVKYLIEQGANILNVSKNTIKWARAQEYVEIIEYLEESKKQRIFLDVSHLLSAYDIEKEELRKIKEALKDRNLENVLIFSARNNLLDIVKYLIETNENFDGHDSEALSEASARNNLEVVEYLCDKIFFNAKDLGHALIYASLYGHLDMVKYLVKKGADVSLFNNCAILRAAQKNHFEIVDYLFENGADTSYPLTVIARFKDYENKYTENELFEIFKYLHNKKKIDISTNLTCLAYSGESNHWKIARYIKEYIEAEYEGLHTKIKELETM